MQKTLATLTAMVFLAVTAGSALAGPRDSNRPRWERYGEKRQHVRHNKRQHIAQQHVRHNKRRHIVHHRPAPPRARHYRPPVRHRHYHVRRPRVDVHHRHYHYRSSTDPWVAWGVGVFTGALVTSVLTPPPPRTIVHQGAGTVVVAPPAATVHTVAPTPAAAQPFGRRVAVTVGALNVRQGPGMDYPVLMRVGFDEVLTVTAESPGWYAVRTASGGTGWVMVQFTRRLAAPLG